MTPDDTPNPAVSRLDAIATHWSLVHAAHAAGRPQEANAARHAIVLRYAPSIRRYVGGMVRKVEDADELSQEVLMRLLKGDFGGADPDRGRFRDFLKTAVRNMVHNHWAKATRSRTADVDPDALPATEETAADPWLDSWRQNLLDHTWAALQGYERANPTSRAFTVLKLRSEYPDDSSDELATRVGAKLGSPVRADACRQMIRRARVRFAEFLIREIEIGLTDPTPDRVVEELAAVGMLEHVRDFLPPDWSTTGKLTDE